MSLPPVLAAILTLARPPAVDVATEQPRLESFAAAIESAVEHVETRLSRADAAMALVAIASHESGFASDVADCRRTGDHGKSITAFQLLRGPAWGGYSRADLCASPELAAHQALRVLAANGQRARTPLGLFSAYAGHVRGGPSKAARDMCSLWERLVRRPGACWVRL